MWRQGLGLVVLVVLAACSPEGNAAPTTSPGRVSDASDEAAGSPSSSSADAPALDDAVRALDLATRYETARAGGRWSDAWELLADRSRTLIGTIAVFESEESAYNLAGGATFSIQSPTRDADLLANFLSKSEAEIARQADVSRGFLVFVRHPRVRAASAGTTGLFIAPLASGEWRIWLVH